MRGRRSPGACMLVRWGQQGGAGVTLKTLAKANAEDRVGDPGLACPDCGEQMEILDDCSWSTVPPPVRVFCEACGFAALRFLRE